jgi:uncharacterized protein
MPPFARTLLIATLLALSGAANAGPLESASAALQRRDFATALQLLRPLAEQGNASAELYLGDMHYFGEGVPQDYAEAMKWFLLAAGQGSAPAQSNLGLIYERGSGVPQDYVQAYKWYSIAASQFAAQNQKTANNRDNLAARMTQAQIEEALRLAAEWKLQ